MHTTTMGHAGASPAHKGRTSLFLVIGGYSAACLALTAEINYVAQRWQGDLIGQVIFGGISVIVTLGALKMLEIAADEWARPGAKRSAITKAAGYVMLTALSLYQLSGALGYRDGQNAAHAHAKTSDFAVAKQAVAAADAQLAKLDAEEASLSLEAEIAAAETRRAGDLAREQAERDALRTQQLRLTALLVEAEAGSEQYAALNGQLKQIRGQANAARAVLAEPTAEARERVDARKRDLDAQRQEWQAKRQKALPAYEAGIWSGKYERSAENWLLAAAILLIGKIMIALSKLLPETRRERELRQEREAHELAVAEAERVAREAEAKRQQFVQAIRDGKARAAAERAAGNVTEMRPGIRVNGIDVLIPPAQPN